MFFLFTCNSIQTSNETAVGEEDETEEGEVGGVDSRSSSRKSILNDEHLMPSKPEKTNNDLLEGISDEDLVSLTFFK